MEFHDSRKERKTWTTPERPTVTSVPVDNGGEFHIKFGINAIRFTSPDTHESEKYKIFT